jgi:FAD-linked sulfhydryl oxidase
MARRPHFTLILVVAVAALLSLAYLFSSSPSPYRLTHVPPPTSAAGADFALDVNNVPDSILKGDSIAPSLENATAK